MKYLSVSTIFKDEALYLREWVEFHLMQGVEHFYLYNNRSADDWENALKPYSKVVTVLDWNYQPGQKMAMNHHIVQRRSASKWTAMIDVDEFFYSPIGTLREVLPSYDKYAALAVHWVVFGSNGLKEYDDRPVIERFTRRADEVNQHVKSIIQTKKTIGHGSNVHAFRTNGQVVDERFNLMPEEYALHPGGTADIFRINHYVTKSEAEARLRFARPRCDINASRDFDIHYPAHDRNEVEDLGIQKFLPALKQRLAEHG